MYISAASSTSLLILIVSILLPYFDGSHVAWVVPILRAPIGVLSAHAHGTHGARIVRLYALRLELLDDFRRNMLENLVYV